MQEGESPRDMPRGRNITETVQLLGDRGRLSLVSALGHPGMGRRGCSKNPNSPWPGQSVSLQIPHINTAQLEYNLPRRSRQCTHAFGLSSVEQSSGGELATPAPLNPILRIK